MRRRWKSCNCIVKKLIFFSLVQLGQIFLLEQMLRPLFFRLYCVAPLIGLVQCGWMVISPPYQDDPTLRPRAHYTAARYTERTACVLLNLCHSLSAPPLKCCSWQWQGINTQAKPVLGGNKNENSNKSTVWTRSNVQLNIAAWRLPDQNDRGKIIAVWQNTFRP